MTRQEWLRWMALFVTGTALAGCEPSSSYDGLLRYKMTAEIETPQGMSSDSAVREVRIQDQHGSNGTIITVHVRGQAVAIKLPNRRVIHALLQDEAGDVDYGSWISSLSRLTRQCIVHPLLKRPIEIYPRHPAVNRRREPAFLPIMATLRDPLTPLSMQRLDARNLANRLGPGYCLRRISVERLQGEDA